MKKENEAKGRAERFLTLDVIRGFAVLLMVIFHVAFDMNSFGFASIDFFENALMPVIP